MKLSVVALVGAASTTFAAQHGGHQHRHVVHDKRGSPVRYRDTLTEIVPGPVQTVYQLQDGEDLTYAEVMAGIASGKYVLVADGTSNPLLPTSTSSSSSTSTPTAFPTPSSNDILEGAAEFFQFTSSLPPKAANTAEPTTTSTSTSSSTHAPTTSSSSSTVPASTAVPSSSSGSMGSYGKIGDDFPSGEISCSTFPSEYGAVYLDWLHLSGWSGIQETPNYSPGDESISYIAEKTSGACTPNTFCSYACPEGYQKSQWPKAQGSTGQSIGGLYCNSDGMLELSNSNHSTICIKGTGTISVKNKLSEQVCICRTDYPGYESETIPLIATAGGTHELTCPDAANYYTWEGSETSAQYYVNPAGANVSESCVWGKPGTDLGNWAPVNLGVGRDVLGVTYVSLIPNKPTNPDGVLDFTIKVKGDVSGTCYYSGGTFYDDGGKNADGCTVQVSGTAYYELS